MEERGTSHRRKLARVVGSGGMRKLNDPFGADGILESEAFVAQQAVLAVVSVLGKDQKGVVAQFATYMAERGINIQDIEQRVVRGFFVMDMLVDIKEISIDLSELITGLLSLGKKIDMEVRVHLHSEKRAKRVAILVSKEPHC